MLVFLLETTIETQLSDLNGVRIEYSERSLLYKLNNRRDCHENRNNRINYGYCFPKLGELIICHLLQETILRYCSSGGVSLVPGTGASGFLRHLLWTKRPQKSASQRPGCRFYISIYPGKRSGVCPCKTIPQGKNTDRDRRTSRKILPRRLLAIFRHRG